MGIGVVGKATVTALRKDNREGIDGCLRNGAFHRNRLVVRTIEAVAGSGGTVQPGPDGGYLHPAASSAMVQLPFGAARKGGRRNKQQDKI